MLRKARQIKLAKLIPFMIPLISVSPNCFGDENVTLLTAHEFQCSNIVCNGLHKGEQFSEHGLCIMEWLHWSP